MTSDGAITLLDATLRDGGYLNDWAFTHDEIHRVVAGLDAAGIDVIEVGYASDDPREPLAAACPVPLLSELRAAIGRARIAVMMRPDVPDPERLIDARRDLVDLVRIPTQVLKPEPAIAAARLVEERGIASSINMTSVSAFTDRQLRDAVRSVANAGVESCLYLADSRGAMKPEDVRHAVGLVRDEWPGVVGFHAHDNLGLALENSETALAAGCTWIDGSLNGYGIGGQNTDLRALVELVADRRPDLGGRPESLACLEAVLVLAMPTEPMELFRLSGEKNLKQEWVEPLVERFGDGAASFLRSLPRRRYQTLEDALRLLTPEP